MAVGVVALILTLMVVLVVVCYWRKRCKLVCGVHIYIVAIITFHDYAAKVNETSSIEMQPNEVYGVTTDSIKTQPNEVYGINTNINCDHT